MGTKILLSKILALIFIASGLNAQQKVILAKDFGPNNSGGTLIKPGGRDCYPSFWIRDYAMSLESGLISGKEQQHMLQLTAVTQCDQTFITKNGSMVPTGAIADHVRIDDDQFFFIHMAYFYVNTSGDIQSLLTEINGMRLIDRLDEHLRFPLQGKARILCIPPMSTGVLISVSGMQSL